MAAIRPVLRSSVPDQVFARLCDLIISGAYAPGERLPTQRELAAEFGVNMASVREAVKRLEQVHLVEVRHGDAMRVLDWRDSGLDVLALLSTVDEPIVRPLLETRRILMTEAARLAAARREPQQAQEIERAAEAVLSAASDQEAQLADLAFMVAIVQAAGNLVLKLILNSARPLRFSHSSIFQEMVKDREDLEALYRAVAEAIASANPDAAAASMAQLTAAHEARMLQAV
jgi:DNA-binding FadR family transcriptional regulator